MYIHEVVYTYIYIYIIRINYLGPTRWQHHMYPECWGRAFPSVGGVVLRLKISGQMQPPSHAALPLLMESIAMTIRIDYSKMQLNSTKAASATIDYQFHLPA